MVTGADMAQKGLPRCVAGLGHTDAVRKLLITVLAAAALAGCGSGKSATPPTTESPVEQGRQVAERAAFHIYDFPDRWDEQQSGSAASPFRIKDEVGGCLTAAPKPVVEAEKYWTQTLVNGAASYVWVLRSPEEGAATFQAIFDNKFRACFQERMQRLINTVLPPGQQRTDLKLNAKPVALSLSGIDYEMVATPTTPGGAGAYFDFTFLQRGNLLAALNFFSTNNTFPTALQANLVRAVADRLVATE